jgi:molecular chaperone Hsp33
MNEITYINSSPKERFKLRDRLISAITKDGLFRISLIKNTNTVHDAQIRHNLADIPALLLARALTSASLMASMLKGEERLLLDFEGAGPVWKVYAEALQLGEVRGFVRMNPEVETKVNTIEDALGIGLLKVIKILYNRPEPTQGIVPLEKSDITTDVASYYTMSEQIPTSILIDVDFDDNGEIIKSTGLLIQALPGVSEEELEEFNQKIKSVGALNKKFNQEISIEDNLKAILNVEYDIVKTSQIDFFCRCSKDKFLTQIAGFGLDEVKSMKKDNANQLVCQYCNSIYYIEDVDFTKLITDLQAQLN